MQSEQEKRKIAEMLANLQTDDEDDDEDEDATTPHGQTTELLVRIVIATEKSASRLFWIALPVYIGLAAAAIYLFFTIRVILFGPIR